MKISRRLLSTRTNPNFKDFQNTFRAAGLQHNSPELKSKD